MKQIDKPFPFLLENGILFEINRQVLHPLGMELEVELDEDGELADARLLDNRDSPDPLYFSAEAFDAGRTLFESYMQEKGRHNIQKRRQIGMVTQTGPNVPGHIQHGGEAT